MNQVGLGALTSGAGSPIEIETWVLTGVKLETLGYTLVLTAG